MENWATTRKVLVLKLGNLEKSILRIEKHKVPSGYRGDIELDTGPPPRAPGLFIYFFGYSLITFLLLLLSQIEKHQSIPPSILHKDTSLPKI